MTLRAMALLAVLAAAGCVARAPLVTTPAYPDFVVPTVPPQYAGSPVAAAQEDAWAYLQSRDLDGAARRFATLLERDGAFFPAAAGLGWVEVARGDPRAAIERFDVALGADPGYVPALVGRGEAQLATGAVAAALQSFQAALAVAPGMSRVSRLAGELRLQVMTERLAAARAATEAGSLAAAEAAYIEVIAASPDSAFLHLELARLLQQQGRPAEALAATRRAQELDATDSAAFLLEGALREETGDPTGALEAYRRAERLDPSDAAAERRARLEMALRAADLPAPYREIPGRATVTRGDLAALLGVRLGELLAEAGFGAATPILTDTRDHWATQWIVVAARAGVMGGDGQYRFEPERPVRRSDLAEVVADTLDLIGELDPEAARAWRDRQPTFTDMGQGHLSYPSAARAVAAGVLAVADDDRFEPTRLVSGDDAVDAVERLVRLAEGSG